MNYKTFNLKEKLLYGVGSGLGDLLIHVALFEYLLSVFWFGDPIDRILLRPRTLYFLVTGVIIALFMIPTRFFKRGAGVKDLIVRTFFQTLVALSLFALSVWLLFDSFCGHFFLQEGLAGTMLLIVWHLLFQRLIRFFRKHGRNKVHTVIVGSEENAIRLCDALCSGGDFEDYKLLGVFSDQDVPERHLKLGPLDALKQYLDDEKVHLICCSINPALYPDKVHELVRICENKFVDFCFVPDMEGYPKRSMAFDELGPVTVIKLREEPLADPVNSFIKRFADIVISGLLLVTVFPLVWCFVALGTSMSSPGPIFFKQKRTGYKGEPFTMLKFRSMKVNDDADKLQATEDDPRKTRFGDFLRRTSLDEIPQLINVFRGDMSLIGPRPHMEAHTEIYTQLVEEYLVRHMIRPGLTGWAQVNGCRGETPTVDYMRDRVRHDIWYIEHWSIGLDVKIFFMTILQLLGGDKQAY